MHFVNMKKQNLSIVTWGSCLSRFTGNHYQYLYGGRVVSSVYHNRTDLFLHNFFGNPYNDNPLNYENLISTATSSNQLILKNQFRSTIGCHQLENSIPFFDLLDSKEKVQGRDTLVFIDNYIDGVAKLVSIDNHNIFMQIPKKDNTNYNIIDFLDIEESIENFRRILTLFREKMPNAIIAFLCFPYDCYDIDSVQRNRLQCFHENFTTQHADIVIRSRVLSSKFKTEDKQHYKGPFYANIAGMVYALSHKF